MSVLHFTPVALKLVADWKLGAGRVVSSTRSCIDSILVVFSGTVYIVCLFEP